MSKLNSAPANHFYKKANDIWVKLIGDPSIFTLESRIFHSISVCLIILGLVYIPHNFFSGLYFGSLSSFIFSIFFSYQYYASRFAYRKHSNTLFALTGIFILSLNFFTNSGIDGSTDLIWPTYLLLVFAISPYKQHIIWLVIYILCFVAIHFVAYYYPLLVQHPFSAGKGELIDKITAFPIPVITIFVIIQFIRRNYDKERVIAEQEASSIHVHNEEITLQKNQLERTSAERNKLLSVISHDMRAPLIQIQYYLELLNENEIDDTLRPKLENDLLSATNNTLDMLSNLLNWSKSQMEGPTVSLLPVNLFSTIKKTLEMSKRQSEKKQISFHHQIDAQIEVIADKDMLQLVLRNLISNAIKFTPYGGSINIITQIVDHECKITVTDNGKGIDKDQQGKIFSVSTEPAYGTNNEKGVGLGLLLCKEFIERQGGKIGFESIAGQGSSFYIFPAIGLKYKWN